MRAPPPALIGSAVLHGAVLALAWVGLPFAPPRPAPEAEGALRVEIVTETPAPSPDAAPSRADAPPRQTPATAAPPVPEIPPEIPEEPTPAPPPKPEPEVAVVPKPPAKPPPKAPLETLPKPKPPTAAARKTTDFAAVLQAVRDQHRPPPPAARAQPDPPPERESDGVPQGALTEDEMAAVRRQIAGCWNIPAGAARAEDLIVRLRVAMNPDRTVRQVEIVRGAGSAHPYWRQAAEGARRAVLRCSPLALPPGKHATWRVINFTFSPREMFG